MLHKSDMPNPYEQRECIIGKSKTNVNQPLYNSAMQEMPLQVSNVYKYTLTYYFIMLPVPLIQFSCPLCVPYKCIIITITISPETNSNNRHPVKL